MMKIRKVTPELQVKTEALLKKAFPGSNYEERLVKNLHKNNRTIYDWVCIHTNKVVAYIAFTNAYNGTEPCGLHLAPLAVKPEFQDQGIGTELLNFALRQSVIRESTLYVLGNPGFYKKFGFKSCTDPICPFTKNNKNFLTLRNNNSAQFRVGYEPEF
jgi:putative acetyltransferase